jgi:hypothetical protein
MKIILGDNSITFAILLNHSKAAAFKDSPIFIIQHYLDVTPAMIKYLTLKVIF